MLTPLNVIAAAAGGLSKSFSIQAGEQGAPQSKGYQSGALFGQDPIGSISPDQDLHGLTIDTLISTVDGTGISFVVAPNLTPDADTSWIDITIDGVFEEGAQTVVLVRSARDTYDSTAGSGGAHTSWGYSPVSPARTFINGNFYTVVIRWEG